MPRLFRLPLVCRLAAALLLGPAAVATAAPGGWDVVKMDGRDYVSVDSIKPVAANGRAPGLGDQALRNCSYQLRWDAQKL